MQPAMNTTLVQTASACALPLRKTDKEIVREIKAEIRKRQLLARISPPSGYFLP
jgi:hypothetical protein